MAKVLFIMKYPLVDAYSLKNKFNGQIRAAEALGHDAYFVGYDRKYTYLIHKGEKTKIKRIWFGNWKQYIHVKAFYDLFDSVRLVCKKEKFDVAYLRRCPLSFIGFRMCRKIVKSGAKLVQEVPTYPGGMEGQPTFLRRKYLQYSRFWWRRVHPTLSLYTLIGDHEDSIGEIPALNIENGTDVELLPLRKPNPDPDKIHILALASMSTWQGYDRIINGIAQLSPENCKRLVLHMVGGEGNGGLAQWTALTKQLGLQDQVVFHGVMHGEELDKIFNSMDIGIGTLGLYRKNFNFSSVLKIREYCARGLPFVYAGDDPAFAGEHAFCMQVKNDDTIIDVAEVLDFAEEMRKHAEIPSKMRQYAKDNMTWECQMRKVFDALGIKSV